MNSLTRFDAHCHIFTLQYALKEAKSLVYDILRQTYPWKKPLTAMVDKNLTSKLSDVKQLLRWLYEIMRAVGTSEQENLNFLQREAKAIYPNDSYSIVPLMMDVFYMFAYELEEGQDVDQVKLKAALPEVEISLEVFQKGWDEVLTDLEAHITSTAVTQRGLIEEPYKQEIHVETSLLVINMERDVTEAYSNLKPTKRSSGSDYYHTAGFDFHMGNLMQLVKMRKNELYPFIAVDPRRPGMVNAVINNGFFEGDEHFYGVKLYPRMGYSPLCKALEPLYEFCNKRQLPITYHCGKGGFPPTDNWDATRFGNPDNFEPILKNYPDIRLNFAHMGSSDPSNQWRDKVLTLITRYNNAYTDLSCYTNADRLKPIKNLWDRNPKLQERLMFGSDFDVMYFIGDQINMQQYHQNFQEVFTESDLLRMMIENPTKFLKIS